jgi:RHH-type proline utilization regulon transcriptional repressor/proline dehydrogenase/delta 1-pyrroline-5-carboxylate dehydrogenase
MDWDALDRFKYRDETETIAALLAANPLTPSGRVVVMEGAVALAQQARRGKRREGVAEGFLRQFSLSTPEGLALMGLAEALLRTPDTGTQDRLIAERISAADWSAHLGQSDSLLVNASTWGLMLTGRLIDPASLGDGAGIVRQLVARAGEPLVRAAVGQAIRIMGEQFVLGRTIDAAIDRAARENLLCSFDMLGEGARTESDAGRYEAAYAGAIGAIARIAAGPERGHGISVKLSALSPRYEPTQEARVWDELYPRLLRLAKAAAQANINFTLDAEEADRLVLSLKILERLAGEPTLGAWSGLGLAVQAYQKRASAVIDALARLAQHSGRRLMVRLVKGAYWDSEIKRAQVAGRPGYPVFTTKAATDLSYLVCARVLIDASPHLFGQFATHNAHTLAAVKHMAAGTPFEFQRLHGMGEALYDAAMAQFGPVPLRTYAPVGAHEDLLPYLVRRLLENGANTSFVHLLMDEDTPLSQVVRDPVSMVQAAGAGPHPRLPLPRDLYGDRLNSEGLDFSITAQRARLSGLSTALPSAPADAAPGEIDAAFALAARAQPDWDARGGAARAAILRAMADGLEQQREKLMALLVREAGKTWPDAMGEVREAADFCRYYALLAQLHFAGVQALKGPAGETNVLELHGRGVFACISPWNFPLSIFTGQIAAALAAGNTVVAKPAEQTPIIARETVALLRAAGLPPDVLQLVPGAGETVGTMLVGHSLLSGIAFTGGTDTAQAINRKLAARPGPILPFIAETGGLNAMFVDTTAQREQVIDDVILSAFGSAGQRCSALRILFLPQETADGLIEGLAGAMDVLHVGYPSDFATDVGPVIDAAAKSALERHVGHLKHTAKIIRQLQPAPGSALLFGPVLAEITLDQLPDREVFGPVLHVVRYPADGLEAAASALAAKGYGLTLGIHSRLESFAARVRVLVPAGNIYVNRSIIGAVVGVQPFGGEGLSGTGPKAGGPYSLSRYAVERAVSINIAAQGGDPALLNL